jgi:hypothetical protein
VLAENLVDPKLEVFAASPKPVKDIQVDADHPLHETAWKYDRGIGPQLGILRFLLLIFRSGDLQRLSGGRVVAGNTCLGL